MPDVLHSDRFPLPVLSFVHGAAVVLSLTGCAATEPLPPPPVEVVVVARPTGGLLFMSTESPGGPSPFLLLGNVNPVPAGFTALNGTALVPLGHDDAVAIVDLTIPSVTMTVGLPANSGATGAAMVDDSIGYVANPGRNSVTRVNYRTGDTASVAVGTRPMALAYTRGRVFVLNANSDSAGRPFGPSWVSVIDPVTNALATGIDSIGLPGPGFARAASVGADGLLYVLNGGDSGSVPGRLSIVNPVSREEVGNFGGIGDSPNALVGLGERLFITSTAEGLMEFDTRTRTLVHGAGDGVSAPHATGVAVGANGRVYTLDAGSCAASDGALTVRRTDLTVITSRGVGTCPAGILVTTIPAR